MALPDDPKTTATPPGDDDPEKAPSAGADAPADAAGRDDSEAKADEKEVPLDPMSPEAILKRVTALGEEDAMERIARIEEAKLAERRALQKKAKKKGGLEAAASKRLAKIGVKAPPKTPAITIREADPLMDRALELSKWAKKNKPLVRWVVGGAVAVAAVAMSYVGYERHHNAQASVLLAEAVADERGKIGDPDKEDDPDRAHDPTPVFRTAEERREAALQGYRAVHAKYRGTGAAILARLAEGSLLLDKEDADGALAAFTEVTASPLAKADPEVRGRALEGLGFAYELKAGAQSGDAAKALLEDAAKQYRTLENTGVQGFTELGMYHEARIFQKEGHNDQAIDVLKKLHDRLQKPGEDHKFVYLGPIADDVLRTLSPESLPPRTASMGGGRQAPRGGKPQIDPAQLQKLLEQMKKSGGAPPGSLPGLPPTPAPGTPQ